ncbi:MAG: peptidyl-prolyl cis-trans isomerase [Parvibaculales bacterium]
MTGQQRLFRLLKDPLIVFFAVGGVLFLLASGQEETLPQNRIMVEKADLLEFLQYRQRRFTGDPAQVQWDNMGDEAKRALIEAYIEEEMLVREARRLGLEANDYIIRRRLVQKLDFIAENRAVETPDDADLLALYNTKTEAYRVPARLSFRHVFIKAGPQADSRILSAKAQLKQSPDSGAAGDPFPYHQTYLNRAPEQLTDQFGKDFVSRVTALAPAPEWRGPVSSKHGLHLVWVENNEPARIPPFEAVRDKVAHDFRQQAGQDGKTRLLDSLKGRYRIELSEDMQSHGITQD